MPPDPTTEERRPQANTPHQDLLTVLGILSEILAREVNMADGIDEARLAASKHAAFLLKLSHNPEFATSLMSVINNLTPEIASTVVSIANIRNISLAG